MIRRIERPTRAEPAATSAGLVWLALAGAAVVLWLFRGLLLPILFASGVAYLLNPVVTFCQTFSIRRELAVSTLFLLLVSLATALGLTFGPRLSAEAAELGSSLPRIESQLDVISDALRDETVRALPVLGRVLPPRNTDRSLLSGLFEGRAASVFDLLEHVGTLLLYAILVPFFAFFLLRDGRRFFGWIMDALPPRHVETTVAVFCEIDRILGRYLRGVVLDAVSVGVLASTGLWLAGIPYPLLLGAVTGFANLVPLLGPLLGAATAAVVSLSQGQGLDGVLKVALVFGAVKLFDDVVLQPLTIGRSVHLHPLLVVASIGAGEKAFGVLGMFLAVPAFTAVQLTLRLLLEHRRVLMGERAIVEAESAPAWLC